MTFWSHVKSGGQPTPSSGAGFPLGRPRAVLDALPPALDGAILGALARGLGDGQPVVVDWEPGDVLAVRIWEEPGDVATLHVVVVSPDGATYL